MKIRESLASMVIGTPLQAPAEAIRSLMALPTIWRRPELADLLQEGDRLGQVLRRALRPETNCIDAGCHLGSVLARFVRLAPRGRHIAVEPLPYKAARLRRRFSGVDVQELALSNEEGLVDFFYVPEASGCSGLQAGRTSAVPLKVTCRRLDQVVPPGQTVGFMKVDVEGAEYMLFQGARRILTEDRPLIFFECTRNNLDNFGLTSGQVFSLLLDGFDYHVYLINDWLHDGPPLDAAQFDAAMHFPFRAFNFIAAPVPVSSVGRNEPRMHGQVATA